METKSTTIIEINGVKLEVDLRTAKRVETLQVGSRVKVLVKEYQEHQVYPGVVVGFEPFAERPAIVVCYLKTDYNSSAIKFVSIHKESKDVEVIAALDNDHLEVNRAEVLRKFDREIDQKQKEIDEIQAKKKFFVENFASFFQQESATA